MHDWLKQIECDLSSEKTGLSPDMPRTTRTGGQERGCICPLPSFPHKHIPFLVGRPTRSTRKNSRRILVQVILFFFFSLSGICLKHWTLDMRVSVGWYRAGLYQWLSLLLLCFLIQTSAALRVWSFCRGSTRTEDCLWTTCKIFCLKHLKSAASETDSVLLWRVFGFFSQHREVASLGFCFKASKLKVPRSHVLQLSPVCGGRRRKFQSASAAVKQRARGAVWGKVKPSAWTMCAAALEKYCGSIFWVSTAEDNVADGKQWDCGEWLKGWREFQFSYPLKIQIK